MRRLNTETAEAAGPDAASEPSGPDRGHPEKSVRWPFGRATSRVRRRPKPRESPVPSIRRPPVEDNRYSPPGTSRSKPQTPRAGRRRDRRTCGSLSPERLDAARRRGPRVRRRAASAQRGPPVSRAPSDFSRSRMVTEFRTSGGPAPKNRGAAERWLEIAVRAQFLRAFFTIAAVSGVTASVSTTTFSSPGPSSGGPMSMWRSVVNASSSGAAHRVGERLAQRGDAVGRKARAAP